MEYTDVLKIVLETSCAEQLLPSYSKLSRSSWWQQMVCGGG